MIFKVARHTLRVCMTTAGIALILIALFTAVARLGLPLVAGYKGEIEARVSDYLKSPVEIGELSVSWEGFGPLLRARQVAVFESPERKVSLDELLMDLNLVKSLIRGVPIINELTLVGASLAIEADAEGQLRLHGMESVRTGAVDGNAGLGTAGPDSGDDTPQHGKRKGLNVVAWLLNASKVGLLDTEVSFIDVRSDRTLVVEDLNIRAENAGEMHQLRVELRMPEELGGTLEAGIDLNGNAESLSDSDGDLYLRAEHLEVKTLSELLSLGQLLDVNSNVIAHIDTGVSLELWGRWEKGRLVSAHGPMRTGTVVDTRTGDTLLDGISAELSVSADGDTGIFNADNLVLSRDSSTLEASRIDSLSLSWTQGGKSGEADRVADPGWTLEAAGQQLELDNLGRLSASLLSRLNPGIATLLRQAQPAGKLHDWTLVAGRRSDGPRLTMQADLDKLHFRPTRNLPGAGPISGRIDIVDLQGEVRLAADSMPLPWPAFTGRDLQLDKLRAAIKLDATDLERMQIDADIALSDKGIDATTRLQATLVPGRSPHLDAQSRYSIEDLGEISNWYPRRKMSAGLVHWLDTALAGGTASNGSLLFFGNLSDFPFDEGKGVFRSSVDIEQGELAFLPDWPVATGIHGQLDLNGLMLTARADQGTLGEFDVSHTRVQIDKLTRPELKLAGTAHGQITDILDFGTNGPLRQILRPVLRDMTGTGSADMDLDLTVQLYRDEAARQAASEALAAGKSLPPLPLSVNGSLFLDDNTVSFDLADIELEHVAGAVAFNENGIRINNLRAQALGRPVAINAFTEGQGRTATTRISASGAMKGSDVLAHYENPLDQFLQGTSNWQIDLSAPHSAQRMANEGLAMHLHSDLVGTELLLPKPLGKGTSAAATVDLDTAFRTGQTTQQWQVRYADQLHANAWVEEGKLESLQLQLGQGSLPASLMDSREPGIRIQGSADTVAVDGWIESIFELIESIPGSPEGPALILPVSAQLNMKSMQVGQRLLGPATLQMNTDETYLNTVVQNRELIGSIRYPREHWTKRTAMKVRVAHVSSALITALASRNTPDSASEDVRFLDPQLLPPIDARVNEMVHRQYTLRDLVLRTQPDVGGLKVTTLGFAYQTMQLLGEGYWRLRDPQGVNAALAGKQDTRLHFVLQGDNFGDGLEYMGLTDVISDGEGAVDAELSWPGPLYLPSLAELDGKINLQLERGNIVPLEPGAGRMVGLFALQALPRRLELDFKDMTADGLAFKKITGDVSIEDGVANVALVQLNGPIGVIDITGKSDLNRQEFDQRITVLPRVSAALPVIGVISGGASAGIGALVATGVLKAIGIDLDRIGLRDYSLTGKWDDPDFHPVEMNDRRRK